MPFLQEIIHKIEVGGGLRVVRPALIVLGLLLLVVGYNWRAFKNMNTLEAMDSAQLGRNIAQGKGYTTLFVRPFSVFLIKRNNANDTRKAGDPGQVKTMHPDIANAPVYPVMLAGLMKVLPFRWPVSLTKPFWSSGGKFFRYEPDFIISLFNQLLLLGMAVGVFFLARKLFDAPVAWLSAALILATELLWRFAVSGLSTSLLMLMFVGLIWCVVLFEQEIREPKWGQPGVFILAAAVGIITGICGLTRYAFASVILPVLAFVILFGGQKRVVLALITLVAFGGVMAPWLARNFVVSGTPFGTAGYAFMENTMLFPENKLERSLEPELNRVNLIIFWMKMMGNIRQIVQNELPRLGGSWITGFFLVGLLVNFRSVAIRRLRYFILMCLLVLVVTQTLVKTQLAEDSPDINTENLLVLVTPIVIVYGVSLFYLLLDLINLPFPELRYIIIGVFSVIASLPLVLTFMPPKTIPVAYPPYFPPAIQTIESWVKPDEMIMSDIPWAVAWYGERQCIWLTLNAQADFFAVSDFVKPVVTLYLTPATMDARFLSQWIKSGEQSWGSFILESMVKKQVPSGFPLSKTQAGWLPEQLVLTDWERWRKSP